MTAVDLTKFRLSAPFSASEAEIGVIVDANGRAMLTVDVNHELPDEEVRQMAAQIIAALNEAATAICAARQTQIHCTTCEAVTASAFECLACRSPIAAEALIDRDKQSHPAVTIFKSAREDLLNAVLRELESHDRCPPEARDHSRRNGTARLIVQHFQNNPVSVHRKFAVTRGADWFTVSSMPQNNGTFETYDEGMREAAYRNCKLAVERGLLDQKMPGNYPLTYRQHYVSVFGFFPAPDHRLLELHRDLVSGAKRLIDSVEFDVNGTHGKGGNGGLTSDQTIRSAGDLRIIISRIAALSAPATEVDRG